MKKTKFLSILTLLCLILSACSGSLEGKEDVIKLGSMAPLTGDSAIYGTSCSNGQKIAVEEINQAGGINGKMIELQLYDEKGDSTEAINAYNRLLDQNVCAIIGDVTSAPSVAVADRSQEDGIPMITPTATQKNVTESGPNIFRVCYSDPEQGRILARFVSENLGKKRVAILANNSSDYSMGIADTFKEKARDEGIEIVAEEGYGDQDNDFRAQLTNIKGKNPQILLLPDYYQKIALIAPQAKEIGIDAILVGGDGWDGVLATMNKTSYDSLENSYFADHYSIKDENPRVANFIEKYRGKYNEDPTAFSALGYDAVYIVAEAIKNSGSTEYDSIIKAVSDLEYDGVTGHIKFDENGDPIKSITINEIRNGEYDFAANIEMEE